MFSLLGGDRAYSLENVFMNDFSHHRYLELADWVLKEAVLSAKEDREWEQEMDSCFLKSGEIRITMNMRGGVPVGYSTQGAGIKSKGTREEEAKKKPAKLKASTDIPAIATKTVKAEDVYKVS
jgi:hypothetical protein